MMMSVEKWKVPTGNTEKYRLRKYAAKTRNTEYKEQKKQTGEICNPPTFSTSYTHGGALTTTTIMTAVGSVANPAQFEIITQKAVTRLRLEDSIRTASIPKISPQRSP